VTQLRNLRIRRVQRRQPRRHGFQGCPHLDHFDDFALRLADDVDATPGYRADEPFLLEKRQCLADGRAAHAECLRELPFVEPQLLRGVVDVSIRNRGFQQRVRLVAQARRVQGRQCKGSGTRSTLDHSGRGTQRTPRALALLIEKAGSSGCLSGQRELGHRARGGSVRKRLIPQQPTKASVLLRRLQERAGQGCAT